jgi:hypothetical protein
LIGSQAVWFEGLKSIRRRFVLLETFFDPH